LSEAETNLTQSKSQLEDLETEFASAEKKLAEEQSKVCVDER
jgi:hypothetical protein